ncbi:MAG: AGE family epimerase/isomerase [Pseudomonadota bacterium]|nr:AGE family epimerase/isomerase [Pseudomonadota bacterium]
MTGTAASAEQAGLRDRAAFWRAWMLDDALPLWAERGVNPQGGFYDRLSAEGRPVLDPMRLRVQARQTFVYAEAARLGWTGDWSRLVAHGQDFLLSRATLPSGLVAQRFHLDGSILNGEPDLYDQSFALLGLASAYRALGDDRARRAAYALLQALGPYRQPAGGFRELTPEAAVLKANPHMHMLEAALAWAAVDDADVWPDLVDNLSRLCVQRLIDPRTGALREFFTGDWRPAPEPLGDCTEPGHHFEWAWLLSWAGEAYAEVFPRLCERAETLGVDPIRGVAVNAFSVQGKVLDPAARLWPQTERLKAALVMRDLDPSWTARACQAADSLRLYTRPVGPGLWLDVVEADGTLRQEASPASSFYHIACAVCELVRATGLQS